MTSTQDTKTYAAPKQRKVLGFKASEINWRRYQVFKSDKRAVVALFIFLGIFLTSLLSNFWVNDKPLFVTYEGKWFVPVLQEVPEAEFGGFLAVTDFTDPFIQETIADAGGKIIWPLVPYHYRRAAKDLTESAPTKPDSKHWLGTDDQSRDVVARLAYGIRISILFGFTYALITSFVGIVVGALQGYYGGWFDLIFQRILEIYASIPSFYVLLIMVSFIAPSFWSLLGILAFFGWTAFVGATRAEFFRARNFDYVRAARALGVSNRKIMIRHVFPNAMVAPITFIPFALASSVFVLSSLDFLGIGMPPGSPSLGEMMSQALGNISNAPHLLWVIFFTMAILTSLLVFVGEGVRNARRARLVNRLRQFLHDHRPWRNRRTGG